MERIKCDEKSLSEIEENVWSEYTETLEQSMIYSSPDSLITKRDRYIKACRDYVLKMQQEKAEQVQHINKMYEQVCMQLKDEKMKNLRME